MCLLALKDQLDNFGVVGADDLSVLTREELLLLLNCLKVAPQRQFSKALRL